MTPALRICLDCGTPHRNDGPRCCPCSLARERRRNQDPRRQALYGGTHRAASRRARRAIGHCAVCGATADLTFDHEHGQVECRSCNSSHRRNPE